MGFICISGSEILLTLLFLNQIAHLIRCLHFGNFVFYHFCSCDIVSLIFLQSLCFFRLIVDHLLFLRFILVNTICQNLGVFCQKLCILFAFLNILLTKDSSLLSLLLHKKVFLLIKTNLDVKLRLSRVKGIVCFFTLSLLTLIVHLKILHQRFKLWCNLQTHHVLLAFLFRLFKTLGHFSKVSFHHLVNAHLLDRLVNYD